MRFFLLLILIVCTCYAVNDIDSAVSQNKNDVTTVDLSTWNHPTKQVFTNWNLPVCSLTLKEKTYPTFYVKGLSAYFSLAKKQTLGNLLSQLYKENGYWDFSLIDSSSLESVEIKGDRENKTISTLLINGSPDFYINKKSEIIFNIITEDSTVTASDIKTLMDIDLNGILDVIIKKDGAAHLYNWDSSLTHVSELDPNLSVVYEVTDVKIVTVSPKDSTPHIQLEMTHHSGCTGYTLFKLRKNKLEIIETNYPSNTGAGDRTLSDIDEDGTLESVTVYNISSVQERVIKNYQEVGATDHQYKTKSGYSEKGFVHPDSAAGVILSYITAVTLTENFDCDYTEEIKALSTSEMEYSAEHPLYNILGPSSIQAYKPELDLKTEFVNGKNYMYSFVLSLDSEEKRYFCNLVSGDDSLLRVDSIE